MNKNTTLFFIIVIISTLWGCTIEKNSGTNDTSDTNDTNDTETNTAVAQTGDPQGPTGLAFAKEIDTDVKFPIASYEDGPTLDDTRASLKAIQEADIVQVVAQRLYAISEASGLAIIDVSTQDSLTLLGKYRTQATPFEMYVRGDRVIALFKNAIIDATETEPARKTSRIVALNVATPEAIAVESTFDIAGEIADSRIIDSILYVASHERVENDYYYQQAEDTDETNTPTTTILSLNVSDTTNITEVARLSFNEIHQTWQDGSWSEKSIVTTDDRLYVSGPSDGEHSTIQVVDISDTSGQMTLGAEVQIDGAIFSRWQIDEYEGILRVVSQPPDEYYQSPPVVQTFTIVSSQEITPLSSLSIILPQPEKLRSVRFDDDRAYVITFEKVDPLFIIDLSDPANPIQAGSLEVPGFVFHLEPKGNRLLGLGFEPGNSEGGLHVSLFDVTDMANPTQLSRVNFGPTWSSISSFYERDLATLGEDRNRLHKLFKVIDSLGLIMVPFSGWDNEHIGCGVFDSGVQLVTFTEDELTKRGAVGATGTARRAFIHNERMFTFSENLLQIFNIDDYDAPAVTAQLPLTHRIHRTAVIGENVVRIASAWDERVAYADIVEIANVASSELGPSINLATLLNEDTQSCEYHNDSPFMSAPLFTFGTHLAIPVVHQAVGQDYYTTDLIVIDTTNNTPTLAAKINLDFEPISTGLGEGIIQVGNALVFQRPGDNLNSAGDMQDIALEVVDMTNPAAPQLLPTNIIKPFAAGATGLHVNSNQVCNGYFAYDDEGYVDYFLDRTDFSDAGTPGSIAPVTFPGLLLGTLSGDYLGVRFAWSHEQGQTQEQCVTAGGEFDIAQNVCWHSTRELQQVTIADDNTTTTATTALSNDAQIAAVFPGENRFFMLSLDAAEMSSNSYSYDTNYGPLTAIVVGNENNQLVSRTLPIGWEYLPKSTVVSGDNLFFITPYYLYKVDTTTVSGATLSRQNIGCETPTHVSINNSQAIVSCGDAGVAILSI